MTKNAKKIDDVRGLEACKWQRDKVDDYEKKILDVINIQNREDLPFDLPPEVKWPSGPREKSERAMILLRMGYAALLQKYGARQESRGSGASVIPGNVSKNIELKNPEIDDSWA